MSNYKCINLSETNSRESPKGKYKSETAKDVLDAHCVVSQR